MEELWSWLEASSDRRLHRRELVVSAARVDSRHRRHVLAGLDSDARPAVDRAGLAHAPRQSALGRDCPVDADSGGRLLLHRPASLQHSSQPLRAQHGISDQDRAVGARRGQHVVVPLRHLAQHRALGPRDPTEGRRLVRGGVLVGYVGWSDVIGSLDRSPALN